MRAVLRITAFVFICVAFGGEARARGAQSERDHLALSRLPMSALEVEALRGDAKAQFVLGERYDTEQNRAQAAYWYRRAAEQGHTGGQLGLGILYEFGTGVPQSNAEAYIWYSLAIASGIRGFGWWRDEIAAKLRADELARAQLHTVLLHVLINHGGARGAKARQP